MLRVLLPKANDPNPTVSANVLMALGELACIGGEEVMPHVPDLMGVIMSSLSDPTLVKRDAALHTLGQVCSSTGYVIQPLIDHPNLLQVLSRILRTEPTHQVRREVIKVLGILGALDPYKRRVRVSGCLQVHNYSLALAEKTGRGSSGRCQRVGCESDFNGTTHRWKPGRLLPDCCSQRFVEHLEGPVTQLATPQGYRGHHVDI